MRPVNVEVMWWGRIHLVCDVANVATPVTLMHRPAEGGFDEAPMGGDELFRAGHQTTCRIVWPIPALQQVLGEMAERPGIGDDAGWPPSLEFLVATFKYFRREPEAVEGLDVGDEAIDAVAQTVGRCRIEMMTPEISDPRACGQ